MSFFEQILTLDRNVTLAINGWHSSFCDQFFFTFSRTAVWIPFFIVVILVLWRSFGWRSALSILLALVVAVLLSDQFCNLIKFTVCRFRPSHEPSLQGLVHTVNGYVGGDYGFCSSHAANTVALTLFTALIVRSRAYALSLSSWVILSCWSRIYLGVHYLGDIICGLLLGASVSLLVFCLWRKTRWGKSLYDTPVTLSNTLIYSYFITVLLISVFSV